MIELAEFANERKVNGTGLIISFYAEDDLDELRKKAIERGYSPSEIIEKGAKPKFFTITDPNGIVVEFGK